MRKIIFCFALSSALISGCTAKGVFARISAEATKEDMQHALNVCPQARDEIARCLNYESSIVSRGNGMCTHPLTKRSLQYIIDDCIGPISSAEKTRVGQLEDFYSVDPNFKNTNKEDAAP